MRLYIDSNVCIKAVEGAGEIYAFCTWLLRPRPGVTLFCSELALSEVLVGPFKKRSEDIDGPIASGFMTLLSVGSPLTMVPVGREVLISAARARADMPSIKLPDAIHLATAALADCTHFVTGDQRLLAAAGRTFATVDVEDSGARAEMAKALL